MFPKSKLMHPAHPTHQNCWQDLCTGEAAPRGALVLWMHFPHGVTPPGATAPPLSSGCLQPGSENVAIYLESKFIADKISLILVSNKIIKASWKMTSAVTQTLHS